MTFGKMNRESVLGLDSTTGVLQRKPDVFLHLSIHDVVLVSLCMRPFHHVVWGERGVRCTVHDAFIHVLCWLLRYLIPAAEDGKQRGNGKTWAKTGKLLANVVITIGSTVSTCCVFFSESGSFTYVLSVRKWDHPVVHKGIVILSYCTVLVDRWCVRYGFLSTDVWEVGYFFFE